MDFDSDTDSIKASQVSWKQPKYVIHTEPSKVVSGDFTANIVNQGGKILFLIKYRNVLIIVITKNNHCTVIIDLKYVSHIPPTICRRTFDSYLELKFSDKIKYS